MVGGWITSRSGWLLELLTELKMCEWFELVQAMTSPEQVRAGSVRNARLLVEKLIVEYSPSSLSEFIHFKTVL